MALKVWLPLNGNINNNGLTENNAVINGSVPFSNGKLGKAADFTSASATNRITVPGLELSTLSVCAWFMIPQAVSAVSCIINEGRDYNTLGWRMYITSANKISLNCANTAYNTLDCATNTWYHACITFGNGTVKYYINGELKLSVNTTSLPNYSESNGYINIGAFGYSVNNTFIYPFNGYINDVRIYDEVLSTKQIKEIAKGLCAHYKLDTARTLNNLKRNAGYSPYNNYSSSGATATVAKTGEIFNGAEVYRLTYTPSESCLSHVQSTLHGHGVYTASTTYKANTKYCYWTLCKPISHSDTIIGGIASNIGGWTELPMKKYNEDWYIVGQYRNGTVTTDKTDSIFTSFKTSSATSGTPIIIDFCCPHLIEGVDYITPEFDYIGTSLTYESDVSGFGHNGTPLGTLTFNNNSPKYTGSTNFSGPGYLHYLSSPLNSSTDAFTFTCWFNPTQASNMALYNDRTTVGSGFSVFYLDSKKIRFDTGGNSQFFQTGTVDINTWTFIACVYDKNNNTKKIYINGTLDGSSSSIGDLVQIGTNASIGNSSTNGAAGAGNQIYGSLSDVRIYCTALSAEDILKLYEISGIIDNKGNTYSYEFIEED